MKSLAISLDLSISVAALCTCNVMRFVALEFLILLESHNAYVAISYIICFIIVQEWPLLVPGVLKGITEQNSSGHIIAMGT